MTPREALKRIIRLANVTDDDIGWDWNVAVAEKARQVAREALAEPERNCNTVSGDDPYVYQSKWCKAVAGSVEPTKYCLNRSCVQCLFRWLVANVEGGAS